MASLEELYRNFHDRVKNHGWTAPASLTTLPGSLQRKIERILRRRALAVALHTDEMFSNVQKAAGLYQDTAVRLYLLLTCIEIIGEMYRGDTFYPFGTWLETKKDSITKERNELLDQVLWQSDGRIDSSDHLLNAVRSIHRFYQEIHGFATHFYVFFRECLDGSLRSWIAQHCWVYKDNPLTIWAGLHLVGPGYSHTRTPELQRLTNARRIWDSLDIEQRIRQIAQCCQLIRNDYTHGLIATPATQDKRSWIEDEYKETLMAIQSDKILLATEHDFRQWQQLAQGSGTLFGVRTVTHDGRFIVLASDLEGKDVSTWLRQVYDSCARQFDHGDTVYILAHHQALATEEKPLTRHLEEWIDNGLKNIISTAGAQLPASADRLR